MPDKFERYVIEGKLGQGGMAAVYLATDQSLNRQVALKVITSSDKESLARFQREAQAIAKLKHPNIIQIYDVGIFGSQNYFTMEYIDGVSLDQLIESSTKTSVQSMVNIILQVASALEYAHQQGIIHRDIKPSNILVNKSGNAYLTDFGIAKQITGLDKKLTVTGSAIGTPAYMSPEQTRGLNKDIDSRCDIFSLGATLYHCITGSLPFEGGQIFETISNINNKDPKAPTSIVRGIPRDLETICLKCLEKDKNRRYQTAGELSDDLKRYLSGEPILARRTMYVTKAWYKARKNKAASLGIASAAVILLIALIIWRVSAAGTAAKLAQYRKEAYAFFKQDKYEEARVACEKIRAITKSDERMNALYEKCLTAIEAENAQTKAREAKTQIREQAKGILDRASVTKAFEEKIRIARDALKTDETFGDAWQVIGYAYKDNKEYDKAVEAFTKAIETTPTLAYAYYERGMITAYIYNKLEEAMPDFEKVLELDPKSHIGWSAKGSLENARKKYDKAMESYNKAIELSPDHSPVYNSRGIIYVKKGELDRAIADFTEAIRLDPKSILAYNNRGNVYDLKAERQTSPGAYRELADKALADYEEAIKADPKYALSYYNRGILYGSKAERESNPDKCCELIDKAIADHTEAIRLAPKYSDAYNNRGIAYDNKTELPAGSRDKLSPEASRELMDKAIADYTEAIRLNPNDSAPFINRGKVYNKKGRPDLALADYNEAIRLDPSFAMAYSNRSTIYYNKNELDKSIADCSEAIRLDNKYAPAYSNRGLAYYGKSDYDKAIADYTEAIRLDPRYVSAYYNRGLAYQGKGQFDPAITDYTEAIRLDPKCVDAYVNRGVNYAGKKDLDSAIADYTQAIRLDPEYTEAYNYRGMAYKRKGQFDLSIADHTEAIRLKPEYADAYINRGAAYAGKKDFDKAIADYTEAIRLDSKYAIAYYNRGFAYYKKAESARGRSPAEWQELIDKAIADYTEAIRLDPKYTDAYNYRGLAYYKKGQFDLAIADHTEAIRLEPEYAESYNYRGVAYGEKNEVDSSIADYTKAINLNPQYGQAYGNRAIAYSMKKDFKSAIADGEMALKLSPNHPAAAEMRQYLSEWKSKIK
ncbi:MAG: tetratricopeptide repeat protein [Planctomycetota bacterium]